MPLATPGKNKFLKFKATRRRQLFKCRWQCRTKTKSSLNKPTRHRQLVIDI
jgi:hypothetical protein